MKMLIVLFFLSFSIGANATEIQGTLMLKGAVKTNLLVSGVKCVCKLKVEKVKNLLEEDNFGNPSYQARIQISLEGRDFERNVKVKFEKELTVINLHLEKNLRRVKDLEYFSLADNIKVTIDSEGRIINTTFPYQQNTIQCNF